MKFLNKNKDGGTAIAEEKTSYHFTAHDYDRKDLWRDVVRIGLGQLVSVDEVVHAANTVLSEFDRHFGPPAQEPTVPESFYDLGPEDGGVFDVALQDVER